MSDIPGKCRLCGNALETLHLFRRFTICIECIYEDRCAMCGEHRPPSEESVYCAACGKINDELNNEAMREHENRPRYQNIA